MAINAINSFSYDSDIYTFTLPYGVCSTAAATAEKTVTVDNFSLETGSMVVVKFSNKNSVANPTLNVNNTGAKPIYRYGTTAASTSDSTSGWAAGAVDLFVYDGTGWIRSYWSNSTYSNVALGQGYATCSTAADTAAKVVSLSSYALTAGGIVSIKFTNAVPASATLNINSKGAKAIFYRGAAITAGIIGAGDTASFIYDGTQYQLISIDKAGVGGTGISVNGFTINHTNQIDAGIAEGSSGNVNHGASITIPTVEYDAQGHIVKKGTTTITLPTETSLSKGTDETATATLTHGGTFTAITDTKVSGHKITDVVTTFTIPTETQLHHGGELPQKSEDLSHGDFISVMTGTEVNGHVIQDKITTFTLPTETQLSKGTDKTGTAQTLTPNSSKKTSFTAITDTSVNNHTVTDTNTTFTLDLSDFVTSGELSTAMVFRGTLGTNGTITSLPTAVAGTVGDTYKVITAGTYASISAKIGDVFVCASYKEGSATSASYKWVLIPSGDEPSGTVTSISAGDGLRTSTGNDITTSGTLSANLVNYKELAADASYVTTPTANRLYGVQLDTNGYLAVNVPWTDNNTVYTGSNGISISGDNVISHTYTGTAGTASEGGVKRTLDFGSTFNIPSVSYDAQGHINGKGSIELKLPNNPNTTGKNIVGASASAKDNASATNGNVYLNHIDGTTITSKHNIKGTGATTVTSDASGNITINSTNTVYEHPTQNALTGVPTANQTPAFGETFKVSQPIVNTLGHTTTLNERTITIPDSLATTSKKGLMSPEDKAKLDATNIAYGVCETEAAIATKVVNITDNDNWNLTIGSIIMVKFTISNSASSVTLNVNNTGAYPIWYNNAEYTSTGTAYTGYADRIITYMFNGTHWVWVSGSYDANSDNYVRVYRQNSSSYNADYPLIASRTKAASLGTVGQNGTYATCYGLIPDTAAYIPTINPYNGMVKVQNLTSTGNITAPVFSGSLGMTRITKDIKEIAAEMEVLSEKVVFGGSDATGFDCPCTYCIINIKKGANHRTLMDCYDLNTHDHYTRGSMEANGGGDDVWTNWAKQPGPDHTHLYAGSASAGGSANHALKLKKTNNGDDYAIGSTNKPVYFKDGVPVAINYEINKNVPSNAVFTDTHYTTGITAGASQTTSNAAITNPYVKIKDDSTHRSQIQFKGAGATTVASDANGVITITSTNTNTTYEAGSGINISGANNTISNTGVLSVTPGVTKGTITVNTNGSSGEVAITGLGSAAYTNIDAYAQNVHKHNLADITDVAISTTEINYLDGVTSNVQSQITAIKNDYVSKTATGTQTIVSGLNVGGSLTTSGEGRVICAGVTNPLFGLQSSNGTTPFYLQTIANEVFLGPTSTVATSWDANGNVIVRGLLTITGANNLVVGGTISEGGTLLSAKYAPISHSHSSYTNQNAFSNIAVSGQTTVAADSATDTVTFVAGTNMTITTDADNDKVTFTATDTKVTQANAITTNGEYPIILANSTATTSVTGTVNKTSTLKYNPSTQTLTTPKLSATTATVGSTLTLSGATANRLAIVNSSKQVTSHSNSDTLTIEGGTWTVRVEDCCFEAGTQVQYDLEGNTKNIEDFKMGDKIISYDINTKEFYIAICKKLIINKHTIHIAKVILEDGTTLVMNEYHPILTENGFHSITRHNGYAPLYIGDKVVTINGLKTITNIERTTLKEPMITYNLDVVDYEEVNGDNEINDTYVANGVVVHNASCPT